MNDEQCQHILDALENLSRSILRSSENIVEAIESIYTSDNGGLEKRLDALIDTIEDIGERRRFYAVE